MIRSSRAVIGGRVYIRTMLKLLNGCAQIAASAVRSTSTHRDRACGRFIRPYPRWLICCPGESTKVCTSRRPYSLNQTQPTGTALSRPCFSEPPDDLDHPDQMHSFDHIILCTRHNRLCHSWKLEFFHMQHLCEVLQLWTSTISYAVYYMRLFSCVNAQHWLSC